MQKTTIIIIAAVAVFAAVTGLIIWQQNVPHEVNPDIVQNPFYQFTIEEVLAADDGQISTGTIRGNSNWPVIKSGSVAVYEKIPFQDVQVGDYVRFAVDHQPGGIVHRVERRFVEGLVLRGFNNINDDEWIVTPENYAGVVIGINGKPFGRFSDTQLSNSASNSADTE